MKYEKSCGAVIIKDNKVLLIKHNLGHWGFPKGHVENNETEVETAIREVKEETNVDIVIDNNNRYVIRYSPKAGIEKDVVFFIGRAISDDIRPQLKEISKVEYTDLLIAKQRITHKEERSVLTDVINDMHLKI